MCQTVEFRKSGIVCETVKELREALPNIEFIKNECHNIIQDDYCLCCIDLDLTFDKADIDWEQDCMNFYIDL